MNSMESLVVVDQSFSAAKQMKKAPQNVNNNNNNNSNNNVNPHYVHQIARVKANNLSQNYATTPQVIMHDENDKMMMMMMMHGGLYLNNQHHAVAPPYHHHHHHHHLTNSFPPTMTLGHGPHQPPLLPFPPAISRPPFHSQPPLRRSQSLSPPVIVPRKAPAKLNKTPPKKENKKGNDNGVNNSVGKSSKARKRTQVSFGPNPDLSRMMSDVEMDVDGCPISPVFRMAPPPSSLPFPRFTLRKPSPPPPPPPMKLMRCKAEAAAVDGAATDNICILLKLR